MLGSNYKEAEKEQTGLDLESKFHSIYVHYFPYEIALLDLGLCNWFQSISTRNTNQSDC